VHLITEHAGTMKVRPDQKGRGHARLADAGARLKGAEALLNQLARLAKAA
jgi:hypothetical protein